MIKKIFLIVIISILPKILFAQSSAKDTIIVNGLRHPDVSIIQLLANPMKYNGYKVNVIGYIHIKFEDCAIYLSKNDADYLNGTNGLWVNFNKTVEKTTINSGNKEGNNISMQYFDCKYVRITGVFNMDERGHMGMFGGAIDSVESIMEERQWYDGNKELWEDKLDGKNIVPKK